MKVLLVAVLGLAGCIRDELVDCGGGLACPAGTSCATVGMELFCVAEADIRACMDHDVFAECALSAGGAGACYDAAPERACLPSGCGNGLLDPGEVCDDRNGSVGDGCSINCTSNETCGNSIVDSVRGEQCDDGDLAGHDGCASDCRPETPLWEQPAFGLPDAVALAALAYDSSRRRLVMFGGAFQQGIGLTVPRDQTWEWDGSGWQRMVTPISPAARFGAAMAYDPVRRKTVLFGGGASGAPLGTETWEWDGNAWTYRPTTTAPPSRVYTSAAYDPERRAVVMFGGSHDQTTTLGDLWSWDGTSWTKLTETAPPPRASHSMSYDPVRGVMVLAGGIEPGSPTSAADTWERPRGGSWHRVASTPSELASPMLAFDGTGMLAFGGVSSGAQNTGNTWRWNGTIWTLVLAESTGTTPPRRELAGLARDPVSDRVVLVGGRVRCSPNCNATYNDTWTWNGAGWAQASSLVPPPRAFHAAAFDTLRGRTVVVGGGTSFGTTVATGETWELDRGHWLLHNVSGPTVRRDAVMAFDAAHGESVLFSGVNSSGTLVGETWLWNGTRWLNATRALEPPARYDAAMAYDVKRRRIVLFGGAAATGQVDDTWEWDGTTWTMAMPVTKPPPRIRAMAAWDPLRERVVLTGGDRTSGGSLDDTWEWDGVNWTELVGGQRPAARGHGAATWNPARGALVLFGGASQVFSQFEDTWELTGGQWMQQFTPARPGYHQGHSLTPSSDGSGVVAYGGVTNSGAATSEVWRLRWGNTGAYELCTIDVDTDGDGMAGCADPDCWTRCAPMCPPGASCDTSWPRCGDGTCSALEDCRICPMDCTCLPVCGDTFCDPGETCQGDCI